MTAPESDWRLNDQERYLSGATLQVRRFRVRPDHPTWDHEHCEFCWAKIVESADGADSDLITEAYATADGTRWICPTCFEDFRDRFGWIVIPSASSNA